MRETALLLLAMAFFVVGPLDEEVFLRGWLLRGWIERYGARRAVIGSALSFSVLHLSSWQLAVAGPLGLLLGWVVVRSRSAVPAILGHVGANTAPRPIDPLLSVAGYTQDQIQAMERAPAWIVWIGCAGVLAGVTTVNRRRSDGLE